MIKEQVIASKGSRRPATKGLVQRPARRDNVTGTRRFSLRAILEYVPLALKVVLAILTVITLIIGYRAAAAASFFQVRKIDVTGTSRTSAEEIEGLTRRAVSKTGVWRADVSAISTDLSKLPGVRYAVVSRVLPDRIRVRITERQPLAVVRTAAGRLLWVDEEGVALGEIKPSDRMPPFFIRGWNEEGTNDAMVENVERVQKYLELVHQWGALGLTERVSEVNLIDLRDIRAQLAGDDSQIEVRLGAQDPGNHLKTALQVLDRVKQSADANSITYVDVQGDKVILGSSSGNKLASLNSLTSSPSAANSDTAATNARGATQPNSDLTARTKSRTKDEQDSKKRKRGRGPQ